MDPLTKAASVVLGLMVLGAVWWYVHDELRQRRRERADVWARQQMSGAETPAADDTVPLEALSYEDDDPPDLVRPYIWGHGDTEEIPRVQDHEPPDQRARHVPDRTRTPGPPTVNRHTIKNNPLKE